MSPAPSIWLVTGPTRSGKSCWAEHLAIQSHRPVTYIATAQTYPDDPEWTQRIQRHRQRRPPHWQLREVPQDLPAAIAAGRPQECLLVDSLGTWLANLTADDASWHSYQQQLLASLRSTPSQVILVAEETGWGIVPAYPLGRQFRDRLGGLTQAVAAIASATYLVVAGYAVDIKHLGQRVPTEIAEP